MSSRLLAIGLSSLVLGFCRQVVAGSLNPHCDATCQQAYRQALASEAASWVNINITTDPFYQNPSNISDYEPGDLVKWDDVPQDEVTQLWNLPAGMSLSRFLYLSQDINGKPIPATAFALLPYNNPIGQDKPLRTVAWTHGTAGFGRNCAPTNHKTLYYEWEGPFAIAHQGYAVIAPDYAGQGSDIPQGFMYESGALHAHDTSFAIQAARKALGSTLSHEWIVTGHSEGGLTAWRTNEREADSKKAIGGFIGAVSLAPALRPLSLISESFRRAKGGPVGGANPIYLLQSLAGLFPEIRIEDYVTDTVLSRLPLSDQGCLVTGIALFNNLTEVELFKNTSWLSHPSVVDWQKRYNGAGPHPLAAPMLVVQGEADILTYPELAEEDFNKTCTEYPDSTAEFLLYPDLDHDAVAQAGEIDYMRWINARFKHVELRKGCFKKRIKPVTDRFALVQQ
ncbi:hypothetical protein ACHAPJ_010792 [Fusarium lateritium]